MEDKICITTPVLENTPRWFSPHTLLPAESTLRPCEVHKNSPNKSAWCKEGKQENVDYIYPHIGMSHFGTYAEYEH